MIQELPMTTNCLRCDRVCRTGTPDPKARAIVAAAERGMCSSCMVQWLLLSVGPVRSMFETGTLMPEIFLNDEWRETTLRPLMAGLLSHTQMREDSIHWLDVVMNWNDPWPKGREPKEGAV